MNHQIQHQSLVPLSRIFIAFGVIGGVVLSSAVFSGDVSGRVNLLYLLCVFVLIPIVGVVVAIAGLFSTSGTNTAVLISHIPIWSQQQKQLMKSMRRHGVLKAWLFKQSQQTALAFSLSSLGVFLLMLLVTDVNIVWRSTLLTPEQVHSLLSLVAVPWSFWEFGIPSIALIEATQDTRLTVQYQNTSQFGQWWQFLLATQMFYGVLIRFCIWIVADRWFSVRLKRLQNSEQSPVYEARSNTETTAQTVDTHNLVTTLPSAEHFTLWHEFPEPVLQQFGGLCATEPSNWQMADRLNGARGNNHMLLVKAWEPPLGELSDYLVGATGCVVPINCKGDKLVPIEPKHRDEWNRFINTVDGWTLYVADVRGS